MGWPYLAPWILIISAILLSIGLHLIFRRKPSYSNCDHHNHHRSWGQSEQINENDDENHPSIFVKFGNITRYLHSDRFESGRFQCSFGNLEVYFGDATISPDGAEIFVDSSFGSIKLYIPQNCNVENRTSANMGELKFSGMQRVDENAPSVIINGNINMGGVEVIFS
jgi:predicted membrane protein